MNNNLLNIPQHKNCTNCGKCCGIIPASLSELEKIEKYIAENNVKPIERSNKTICPFRDDENKKCLIYSVRPVVCRLFGVAKGNMKCINGNTNEIDGTPFIQKEQVRILNFVKWKV